MGQCPDEKHRYTTMVPFILKFPISELAQNLKNSHRDKSYTDVTLVTDDKIPIKAHKFVLSSFSLVIRTLLLDNSHTHPMIFLRGVSHRNLKSILQFMYYGRVEIQKGIENELLDVAEDLQIKALFEVLKNIEINDKLEAELVDGKCDDILDDSTNQIKADQTSSNRFKEAEKEEEDIEHKSIVKQEQLADFANESTLVSNDQNDLQVAVKDEKCEDRKHTFKCEECESIFMAKRSLARHMENIHEGIRFPCQLCSFVARRKSHLKYHQQSVHEGIRYFCTLCTFSTPQPRNLKDHKETSHEGVRYFCNLCDFSSKQQRYVKIHMESIHMGVRFTCDQCGYEARQKNYLRRHQLAIHGGATFSCDQCPYTTNRKERVKRHQRAKHSDI